MAAPADNTRGIIAMVLGSLSFFTNDILVKFAAADLPLGEIICLRGVMGSIAVCCIVVALGHLRFVHLSLQGGVIIRVIAELLSTLTYLTAFIALPVAEASAIFQTLPLASTAAGALFLGEKVGWRRWLAVLAGVIGMLMILKPGTSSFSPAALLMLASVGLVLLRDVMTSRIPPEMPTTVITAVTAVAITGMGLAMQPFEAHFSDHTVWVMPSVHGWILLASAALFLMLGYAFMVIAVRSAEMSAIAPLRYTALILSFAASILLFHEIPDAGTWIGAGLVAASGVYTFHRENVRRQAMHTAT